MTRAGNPKIHVVTVMHFSYVNFFVKVHISDTINDINLKLPMFVHYDVGPTISVVIVIPPFLLRTFIVC